MTVCNNGVIQSNRQHKCAYEKIGILRRVGPKTTEVAVTNRIVVEGGGKITAISVL